MFKIVIEKIRNVSFIIYITHTIIYLYLFIRLNPFRFIYDHKAFCTIRCGPTIPTHPNSKKN